MSAEPNFLDVKIMGRDYRVACTPEERDALLAAVDLVDGKMREIRSAVRSPGLDRVAVLAALNIAHEMLALRSARSAFQAPPSSLEAQSGSDRRDQGLSRAASAGEM